MPILFNHSSAESLLSFIENQVKLVSSNKNKKWVFYAATCYFKGKVIENLVVKTKRIIGDNLLGFHILVDKIEWIQQNVDIDNLINEICHLTNLKKENVSFTPVSHNGKLFHAKSYALIEVETVPPRQYEGFVIITSGNLTQSGLKNNTEIGCISYDKSSLLNFINIFTALKDGSAVSQEQLIKQKEFRLSIQTLSLGKFYHKWERSPDLRFRLNFSQEERRRLRELTLIINKNRYGEFEPDQRKTLSIDLINIQSIFNNYPQPIPDTFWSTYSVETLLGQWVPREISKLIEDELNKSIETYIKIIKSMVTPQKISQYVDKINRHIKDFVEDKIIDNNSEHEKAVESWKERIEKIFHNEEILRLYFCKYEKINLPINTIERQVILATFDRIKYFYSFNKQNRGVAKGLINFADNNIDIQGLKYDFSRLAQQARETLEDNRIGNLNEIQRGQRFFATQTHNCQPFQGIFLWFNKNSGKFSYITERLVRISQKKYLRTFRTETD